MPISERIIKEIICLSNDRNKTALLLQLLAVEDKGKHYKSEYEKLIKQYIKENSEE